MPRKTPKLLSRPRTITIRMEVRNKRATIRLRIIVLPFAYYVYVFIIMLGGLIVKLAVEFRLFQSFCADC